MTKNNFKLYVLAFLLSIFTFSCSLSLTNTGSISFNLDSSTSRTSTLTDDETTNYEYTITLSRKDNDKLVFYQKTTDKEVSISNINEGIYNLRVVTSTPLYHIEGKTEVKVFGGRNTTVNVDFVVTLKDFDLSINNNASLVKVSQFFSEKKLNATVYNFDNLPLSYQWQKYNKETKLYEDIKGATDPSYDIPNKDELVTDNYRVVVTNTDSGAYKTASVDVKITPWIITIDGRDSCNFGEGEYILDVYNEADEYIKSGVTFTSTNELISVAQGILTIPKATEIEQKAKISATYKDKVIATRDYTLILDPKYPLSGTANTFEELQKEIRRLNSTYKAIEISIGENITFDGKSSIVIGNKNSDETYTGDYDVTLIGQGANTTLERSTSFEGPLFIVGNGCSLTIKHTDGTGKVVMQATEQTTSDYPFIKSYGNLSLQNCELTGNVNTTTVETNKANLPGAIYVGNEAKLTKPVSLNISDSSITHITTYKTGAIYVNNEREEGLTVSINSATIISDNISELGALTVNSTSTTKPTIEIIDSDFNSNWSINSKETTGVDNNGGAINIDNAILNISNSELYNNTADNNGGAIFVNNSDTNLIKVKLQQNLNDSQGVPQYKGNYADNGAGIYANNSTINLIGTIIENQIANNNGGGIYLLNSSANITEKTSIGEIVDFSISGNTAKSRIKALNGAGIYSDNSTIILDDSSISENVANMHQEFGGAGGGVYLTNNSSIELKGNASIHNNTSDGMAGGGIYADNGCIIKITNGIIKENVLDNIYSNNTNTFINASGNSFNLEPVTTYDQIFDNTTEIKASSGA